MLMLLFFSQIYIILLKKPNSFSSFILYLHLIKNEKIRSKFFFLFHIIHLECCLEISKKMILNKLNNKNKTLFNGMII